MALRLLLLLPFLAALLVGPAKAQNRLALVIGNDAYQNVDPLRKAVNDARAVAASLRRLGFAVSLGENLSRRAFVQQLASFEARLKPGDTAFVFYAGHGVEIEGANYLLPVDIPKAGAGQQSVLKDEAISTDGLIQRLKARGTRAQIVVLDACRENPFRDAAGRSVGGARGLGPSQATSGVFILYSAGIGEVALDRLSDSDADANSVFTRTLVPLMENPNFSLVTLAKETRTRVKSLAETVGHRQSPAYYDEIDGDLFLARPGGQPAPQVARVEPVPGPPPAALPAAPLAPPVAAPREDLRGFLFPDSDRRHLRPEELRALSREQLRIARNEIYARKGRFFRDAELAAYFARQSWYRPHSWEVTLNPVEQANVRLIQSLER
jgi:hypothetical protein